jgi:hypothetical protein
MGGRPSRSHDISGGADAKKRSEQWLHHGRCQVFCLEI